MAKLKLTVACGDYEIVRALSDGTVQAELGADPDHRLLERPHVRDHVQRRA